MMVIERFDGRYRGLSNFFPSRIEIDGVTYRTVEHAFQALKSLQAAQRLTIAAAPRPGLAKKLGGPKAKGGIVTLREDWEQVKDRLMLALLCLKFSDASLAHLLVSTHPARLIEGNYWGDTTWGAVWKDGCWVGENRLGRLLEQVRTEIMEGRATDTIAWTELEKIGGRAA